MFFARPIVQVTSQIAVVLLDVKRKKHEKVGVVVKNAMQED